MKSAARERIQTGLRAFGIALSVVALAWIGTRFFSSGAVDLIRTLPTTKFELTILLIVGALGYAAAMCLPAFAWWRLVATLSMTRPPLASTCASYAVTQFGKYLPGNIAHYALRHTLARRSGLPHASLGVAAMLEALLLLLAALALTMTTPLPALRTIPIPDIRIVMLLLLVALASLWAMVGWVRHRGWFGARHVPHLPLSVMLSCVCLYAAFFIACAALLAGLAKVLGIEIMSYAQLLSANTASWSAGFIVFGAPAGLGVRETAFVALATQLDEKHALLLISLFRVVTFLGDTILLASGTLMLRRERRASAERVS